MQGRKEKVALGSILASGGLTVGKAVVGVLSGSLALLSEAAHSFIDLIATVMTYFAVRVAGRPADEEHHYGHGKFESVTALAETVLLFVLCGVVIWEAMQRLIGGTGHAVEATVWAFGVIVVSIVVDFFRARLLNRVAGETGSGTVRNIHNVRVRETDEGEIVNFHRRVDPALTVQAVHEKVDEVERALRRRAPSIKRVIGHAEPKA